MDKTNTTCAVDGCERGARSRGWCNRHYEQWRKTGNPVAYVAPLEDRMEERTVKSDGCWMWVGSADFHGYGQISYLNKKSYAHRVAYELAHGEIPAGMRIDHVCHQPLCVNPDHLRAVTIKQNAENFSGLNKNNRSGARGVWFDERRNRWCVQVNHNQTRHWGGSYATVEEADEAARALRNQLHTHNDLDRVA